MQTSLDSNRLFSSCGYDVDRTKQQHAYGLLPSWFILLLLWDKLQYLFLLPDPQISEYASVHPLS